MQTLRKAALFLMFSLTAVLAQAAPNLILNGDFESPAFANWSYTGDGFQVGPDITGSPAAHPTDVFFDGSVNALGFLFQTINGLTIGATYTLSFDVQRWTSAGVPVDNEILVRFGGDLIWQESDVRTDWMVKTFSVVADATSMLLEFGNISADPVYGTQLDNIVLALAEEPPVGVPEPGTLFLFGGMLPLLWSARRHRQARG